MLCTLYQLDLNYTWTFLALSNFTTFGYTLRFVLLVLNFLILVLLVNNDTCAFRFKAVQFSMLTTFHGIAGILHPSIVPCALSTPPTGSPFTLRCIWYSHNHRHSTDKWHTVSSGTHNLTVHWIIVTHTPDSYVIPHGFSKSLRIRNLLDIWTCSKRIIVTCLEDVSFMPFLTLLYLE